MQLEARLFLMMALALLTLAVHRPAAAQAARSSSGNAQAMQQLQQLAAERTKLLADNAKLQVRSRRDAQGTRRVAQEAGRERAPPAGHRWRRGSRQREIRFAEPGAHAREGEGHGDRGEISRTGRTVARGGRRARHDQDVARRARRRAQAVHRSQPVAVRAQWRNSHQARKPWRLQHPDRRWSRSPSSSASNSRISSTVTRRAPRSSGRRPRHCRRRQHADSVHRIVTLASPRKGILTL